MTAFDRLPLAFADSFGSLPDRIARAPGRVNLIGEHTDYNDGFVLPAAISVETRVAARARRDNLVTAIAADLGGARAHWLLDDAPPPPGGGDWSAHVRGMVAMMLREGYDLPGLDLMITGSVPRGAGLSSSASLAVALGMALHALTSDMSADATLIAQLAQRSEIEVVGTNCGIMDQLVSARGVGDHALLIDCRSLAARAISLPSDLAIVIIHSGITRGLVDGAYNQRRAACEAVASALGVAALRDVDVEMLQASESRLAPLSFRRARHVVTENARTLAAADALVVGDLALLGKLMAASHASMRDDFEISLPPIDALVALLQAAIGGDGGARMTGGGFGGAVVAVLPNAKVEAVLSAVKAGYRTPDGGEPMILVERGCHGASLVAPDAEKSA